MAAEVPIIRPAEVADLSAIERIYGHYVTNTTASFELEPPDASAWRDRFALVSAAGLPFVVAELPAAGGGGVGGGGVVAGVREVIAVIADTGDPASVRLHTRHGFLPAGRLTRVGFKHGSWLDTVLLQRSLG
ncbi:MAG: hypothetical protein QOI68_1817 [Pseudonocardiales bacterium]|nr:hypothetical protein [Pseudonocardiales bacterium]